MLFICSRRVVIRTGYGLGAVAVDFGSRRRRGRGVIVSKHEFLLDKESGSTTNFRRDYRGREILVSIEGMCVLE